MKQKYDKLKAYILAPKQRNVNMKFAPSQFMKIIIFSIGLSMDDLVEACVKHVTGNAAQSSARRDRVKSRHQDRTSGMQFVQVYSYFVKLFSSTILNLF